MTPTLPQRIARKIRQTRRLSRKSIAFVFLLAGSALVALTALFFAHLADFALELNTSLVQKYPWFAWIALPLGLPAITWFTRKYAPRFGIQRDAGKRFDGGGRGGRLGSRIQRAFGRRDFRH